MPSEAQGGVCARELLPRQQPSGPILCGLALGLGSRALGTAAGGWGRRSPVGPSWVGVGLRRSRKLTWQEFTTMLSLGFRLRVLTMPGAQ